MARWQKLSDHSMASGPELDWKILKTKTKTEVGALIGVVNDPCKLGFVSFYVEIKHIITDPEFKPAR